MNIKKKIKHDLKKIETPQFDKIMPVKSGEVKFKSKPHHPHRHFGVILTAAALAVLLVVGCGAAIPEILARLNSPKITDVTYKQTEVPDGWIGIYDYDDLLQFNDVQNKNGKFIFMSDIAIPYEAYAEGGIFEGGIEPLGIYRSETPLDEHENVKRDSCFTGEVNGNGYVISNLKLKAVPYRSQDGKSDPPIIAGLFGYGNVKVIHLGIENVEINVELDENTKYSELYVGALAAQAESVMGCYAKNVNVCFSDRAQRVGAPSGNISVGGLCGFASYIDSCFVTNASISANISNKWDNVMLGGISGTANACVTSYFEGDVSANKGVEDNVYTDGICAMHYPAYIPKLLSAEAMEAIRENFRQADIDDKNFYHQKFLALYLRYDPTYWTEESWKILVPRVIECTENFYMLDTNVNVDASAAWYVLDSAASVDDIKAMTDVIIDTFGGDVFAMEQFCADHNIKTGKLYCHSFNESETISSEKLMGFDFERIWVETENGVKQRIFTER